MVVDKFRSVQKITKPILKKFCKTDRQTDTQTDTQTGSPVEVPPELKKYPRLSLEWMKVDMARYKVEIEEKSFF